MKKAIWKYSLVLGGLAFLIAGFIGDNPNHTAIAIVFGWICISLGLYLGRTRWN